jgi:hypothetical protein
MKRAVLSFVWCRLPLALGVVASWLAAIALIVAALQILFEGRIGMPDHME